MARLAAPGTAVLTGTSGLSGLVVVAMHEPLLNALLFVATLANAARVGVHLRMGYLSAPGPQQRELATLTRLEGCLGGALAFLTALALSLPPPRVVTAIAVWIIVAALLVVSGASQSAARRAGLQRGTEWVRQQPRFVWLENALQPHARTFGAPAVWVIRKSRPVREASCYLVCIIGLLVAVALGETAASIRPVRDLLTSPQTHRKPEAPPPGEALPTPPPSSSQRAPNTATPELTYEEVCSPEAVPGRGAPEPQASHLRGLWLGGAGHEGVGAVVAGCAGRARLIDGETDAWMAVGMCGQAVRAVAVAARDGTAAIALGQVARFALKQAATKALTSLSARRATGSGDFQVVKTRQGSFVLARASKSGGATGAGDAARGCHQSFDRDAAYTVLPPGAVEAWAEIVRREWTWPVALDRHVPSMSLGFFRSTAGREMIGWVRCASLGSCVLSTGGRRRQIDGDGNLAASELLRAAPEPVQP